MAAVGDKSDGKSQQGLEVLYCGESEDVSIDIIAVPGLGSDPSTSFDSFHKKADGSTQFNWLSDKEGLSREFPTARILLYHYESRWFKGHAIDQSMGNASKNLLDSICSFRQGATTRPIVFIGHSMGGLVVAKAITMASIRGDDYPHLVSCVAGSLFFGTPFQGSHATGKAIMLASVVSKIDQAVRSRVLTFLEPGNEALDELRDEFVRITNKLQPPMGVSCFYEQTKTDYSKEKLGWLGKTMAEIVVTEQSARLPGYDPVGMACNHRELNRFDGAKDGRWDLVRIRLKRIISKARTVVRTRLNAARASIMDDQTLAKLLANLSVGDVQKKKSAVSQLSGRSLWVSNDPIFKKWMALDGKTEPTDLASTPSGLTLNQQLDNHGSHNNQSIWISGQEGRGKSKAAISIIDDIEKRQEQNAQSGSASNIVVAFFFADSTTDLSSAENILKSVLWQLINKRRSLAQYAKDFTTTDRSKKKGVGGSSEASFTVPALWKVLMEMLQDPGIEGAYFVLNSLHELPEDAESTKQLLELIQYDVVGSQEGVSPTYDPNEGHRAPMRWLFTSRRRDNIKAVLGGVPGVTEMNLDDPKYGGALQLDLRAHARRKVAELAKRKGYSPALQYYASSLVERRAENMVWIDVICRKLELLPANTIEVRKALAQAPQNLATLLDRTWSSVLDERSEDVEWTKELLRALMLAFDDPTVEELGTLAEVAFYGQDKDNKSKLVEAINRCGPLIKIIDYDLEETVEEGQEDEDWEDEEVAECRVTFLHSTARIRLHERAKELLGLGEDDLKIQHGAMALRSFSNVLKALTPPKELEDDDDDEEEEVPDVGETKVIAQQTNEVEYEEPEVALNYCLEYWLRHAQQATADVVDSLKLDQAFWALTSDVRNKWWSQYTQIEDDYSELSNMTALHVAAFFGFTPLVTRLLETEHRDEINTRDSWDNQPLHWAAEKGHLDVVQLLLDSGADINDGRQDHVWTPLMMAASTGQLNAMTMLLTRQAGPADINAYASDDGTALTLAIARGELDAVKHLLKYHADANLTGPGLEPPLALSASTGNKDLVKLIMDAGGYQNTQSPVYGSALAAAASSSNLELVQIIIPIDHTMPSCQHALEQAAAVMSKEIVDFLLKNVRGLQCDIPFTKAAAKGANDILQMLWTYSNGTISQKSKNESLYMATDFELQATVELLLAMHADPNAEGEEYGNALTAAAYDGTTDIVVMLLNAGAHIRHPAGYPLQAAASQGHEEVIMLLLQKGANVNEVNPKFDAGTALQAACVSGFDDTVDLLLKRGADPNLGRGTMTNPIIAATRKAEANMVEMLVNARVNVNVFGGEDNSTPLNNAAITLPVHSMKTLVDRGGANVNQVDKDGDTALKLAAMVGDHECVQFLLERGADVHHSEGHNGSALHAAAARGSVECCRLLLARGASPSLIAGPYQTVIQAAAASGDVATMNLILEADPRLDVNVQGGQYGTALHAAAMQTDSRCVKVLLERGANSNTIIGEHGTALQLAAFTGCNRNVKTLIAAGANVNTVSGKHGTALQAAALKCESSTLEALLEAGAKLEVDDGKGQPNSKRNGKYGSALAASAARVEIDNLYSLLSKDGWSTTAFRDALETSVKYNYHGSFRMIIRSTGGKALPKNVKSNLRKKIKRKDETDVGDTNSDFGDDVVYNEQDPDEDDEEEEEEEEEEDESAHIENNSLSGERGLDPTTSTATNNSVSNTRYGPPSGYGAPLQAQQQAHPSYGLPPQSVGLGQTQRGLDGQQQDSGRTQQQQDYSQSPQPTAYTQSDRGTPQYQAYNGGDQQSYGQQQHQGGIGSRGIDSRLHTGAYESYGDQNYHGYPTDGQPQHAVQSNPQSTYGRAQAYHSTNTDTQPGGYGSQSYGNQARSDSYNAYDNTNHGTYPGLSHVTPANSYPGAGYPPQSFQQTRSLGTNDTSYDSVNTHDYPGAPIQSRTSGSHVGGYAAAGAGGAIAGGYAYADHEEGEEENAEEEQHNPTYGNYEPEEEPEEEQYNPTYGNHEPEEEPEEGAAEEPEEEQYNPTYGNYEPEEY